MSIKSLIVSTLLAPRLKALGLFVKDRIMQTEDHAKQQAAAQLSSIRNMLAALYCDYDRLEELRDEHTELTNAITGALDGSTTNEDRAELEEALAEWNEANAEELASLEEAAGDCPHYDRALENIQNDPDRKSVV